MPRSSSPPKRQRSPAFYRKYAEDFDPLMVSYEGNRKLSIFGRFPAHAKLLGVIAGLSGTLEHAMGLLFEEIMAPREAEAREIFYALGNNKARRDILRVAGRRRFSDNEEILQAINKVVNAIARRADRRNDLLHHVWVYFVDADAIVRHSPRSADAPNWFIESEHDLKACIASLKKTITDVMNLRFYVRDHLERQGQSVSGSPTIPDTEQLGSQSALRTRKRERPLRLSQPED